MASAKPRKSVAKPTSLRSGKVGHSALVPLARLIVLWLERDPATTRGDRHVEPAKPR